jgi:20S proteasome subunit alpha 2
MSCAYRSDPVRANDQEGFEGQMTEHNIELAVVGEDRKLKILTPAEIKDYLAEVE